MNRSAVLAVLGTCVTLLPATGLAQAWLPPKGEVSFVLGFQNISADEHLGSDGQKVGPGEMRWNTVLADFTYGVTDRFALRAGIPFIFSRYQGDNPHTPITLDDGKWHDTFTDFRVEARYMATAGGFAITPFVSGQFPSHHYQILAHSAFGKDIWEVGTGVNVGRLLDPVLPDGYFQVRYGYTFAEKVIDVSHDRSNVALELGYFVTPALSVRALGAFQATHGGFLLPTDAPRTNPIRYPHHDQLTNEDFLRVGLGVGYALTGSVDVFVSGYRTLSGKNALPADMFSFGFAYNFAPAQIIRKKHRQTDAMKEP